MEGFTPLEVGVLGTLVLALSLTATAAAAPAVRRWATRTARRHRRRRAIRAWSRQLPDWIELEDRRRWPARW